MAQFVRHVPSGRYYVSTPELLARGDIEPVSVNPFGKKKPVLRRIDTTNDPAPIDDLSPAKEAAEAVPTTRKPGRKSAKPKTSPNPGPSDSTPPNPGPSDSTAPYPGAPDSDSDAPVSAPFGETP